MERSERLLGRQDLSATIEDRKVQTLYFIPITAYHLEQNGPDYRGPEAGKRLASHRALRTAPIFTEGRRDQDSRPRSA